MSAFLLNLNHKLFCVVCPAYVRVVVSVFILISFLGLPLSGFFNLEAAANSTINFQSRIVRLTDGTNLTAGSPSCIAGGADTCDFRASIYADSSGGSALWQEVHSNVELGDNNGIFNLVLNSTCTGSWSAPASPCSGTGLDWGNDSTVYLEIEFDSDGDGDFAGADTEAFSRKLLTSVPYAYYADTAGTLDGVDSTGFVQLQPTLAQSSTGSTSLIHLDETGGSTPNFIEFEVGGTDVFTIANGGDVTSTQATPSYFFVDSTASEDDYSVNVDANAFTIVNSTDSRTELSFGGSGGIDLGDNTATKTIDIGGVTSSATDTINIATNSTAADVITIGNANASTTLTLTGGTTWSITSGGLFTTAGDIALNGDDLTSDGILTINATTYTRIGDTGTPGSANGDDDLYVEGDLEVDGVLYLDGTLDTSFTAGSVIFAGTNGVLTQDNSNFFFDDSANDLYIGGTTAGAADIILADDGGATFNGQNSSSGDFTIEGQTNSALFIADVSRDGIGIGTTADLNTLLTVDPVDQTTNNEYVVLSIRPYTQTFSSVSSSNMRSNRIQRAVASGTGTITNGATLWIDGSIVTSGVTITNNYALWVDTSDVRFDQNLLIGGDTNTTGSGNISLNFGGTNTEILRWDDTQDSFVLTDDLLTSTNNTNTLGSSAFRWSDLYTGPSSNGSIHVGTSTADEGTISYDTVGNILNIGTDSTTNGDIAFFTDDLYIDKSIGSVGIGTTTPEAYLDVDGAYSLAVAGEQKFARVDGDYAIADTGIKMGLRVGVQATHTTGTLVTIYGTANIVTLSNAGNITNAVGSFSRADIAGSGTINSFAGFQVDNRSGGGGGSLVNQFGLYVADLTSGTNQDIGVYVAGADNYGIWVDNDTSRFDGDVVVGGNTSATSTIANGFSLGGDDLFVAGSLGVESALYTDGSLTLETDIDTTGAGTISLNFGGVNTESLTWNDSSDAFVVSDDFLPNANDTLTLGSTSARWSDIFIGPNTLHIGTSSTDEGTVSYDTTNNIFDFSTDATTNADIAFFGNDLYLDKSAGFVGMGIVTPGQELEVNGDIRLDLNGGATLNGLCHSGAGTANQDIVDCSGAPGDIAEWYAAEESVNKGEIVTLSSRVFTYLSEGGNPETGQVFNIGNENINVLKKAAEGDVIIGIVSTGPYQTFGEDIYKAVNNSGDSTIKPVPIGLKGRVPIKISPSSDPINPGDPITISSDPGLGKKATTKSQIVARALESWTPSSGKTTVLAFISDGEFNPSTAPATTTTPPASTSTTSTEPTPSVLEQYFTVIDGSPKTMKLDIDKFVVQGAMQIQGNLSVNGDVVAKLLKVDKITTDAVSISDANSAGRATLVAGQTSVVVNSTRVDGNSIVLVTPNEFTNFRVTSVNAGQNFTIEIPTVLGGDVHFSYMVIN